VETEFIIKAIIGLILILAVLIFLLFLEPNRDLKREKKLSPVAEAKKDDKEKQKEEIPKINTDLFHLVNIIKNKSSSAKVLSEALELVIKHHGKVHKKLGLRPHPDFDIYIDILFTICRHPNANKDMIITFDRDLEKLNPEYKQEINEAIAKGLNSRGF